MIRQGLVCLAAWSLALPVRAAPDAVPSPSFGDTSTFGSGEHHTDEVDVELARAAVAFDENRLEDAIAAFEAAYELEADPSFLYNIGRVYEELGELRSASDYYGRFATEPGVNLELRRQALERMQILSAIVEATAAHEAEPTRSAEPPPPVVEERSVVVAPDPRIDGTKPSKRRALTISGFTLLGVGLTGVAAGGVFAGLARNDDRRLSGEDDPAQRSELVRRGERRAALADAFLIGGAVVATIGLVMGTVGALRTRRSQVTAGAGVLGVSF